MKHAISMDEPLVLPQAWLIQCGGWLACALISMLGALPYRHAFPVVVYFAGMTVAAFLASFGMRALCRRLVGRALSWPRLLGVMGCAYALGVACSTAGAMAEVLAGSGGAATSGWRAVALAGFANAFIPAIMLVAWSALYLAVQRGRDAGVRERPLLPAGAPSGEAASMSAMERLRSSSWETRLQVRNGGRTLWIGVGEIDWIEASGDYVTLHVGERLHMLRESMEGIERRLDPSRFARIHRSTIISLSRVQGLSLLPTRDAMVTLRNGKELRVSRRFRHRISADGLRRL